MNKPKYQSVLGVALLSFLVAIPSLGAGKVTKKMPRRVPAIRKEYRQLHFGYQMNQETINATSSGVGTSMLTQFHGFRVGLGWHSPRRNLRWVRTYGVETSFGLAKGVTAPPAADLLREQPWLSVGASAGYMYRTTSKSEIGFALPVQYRAIFWEILPSLSLEKEQSFSAGLSAMYVARFDLKHSVQATLTHQYMWESTIWSLSYQYDFR